MNVLFFITPKENVSYLYSDFTLRQALENFKNYNFSCLPIIDRSGHYINSISEGDFLWTLLKNDSFNIKDMEHFMLSDITTKAKICSVNANADIDDLISMATNQNFVPIVDDNNIFIGIVTRKDIILHYSSNNNNK